MRELSHATPPIVVFDLEYTAWEGSKEVGWSRPGEIREIVQIGAVQLTPDTLEEQAPYERLIKPVFQLELSDYFIQLTGVTQQEIEVDGCAFSEALNEFVGFIGNAGFILCNGSDGDVIRENCDLHKIDCPAGLLNVTNIRQAMAGLFNRPIEEMNSGDFSKMLGLTTDTVAHHALSDARAVAVALRHFRQLNRI